MAWFDGGAGGRTRPRHLWLRWTDVDLGAWATNGDAALGAIEGASAWVAAGADKVGDAQ